MKEKGASPLFQVSRATLHETRQFTTVFVPTEATEEDALGLVAAAIPPSPPTKARCRAAAKTWRVQRGARQGLQFWLRCEEEDVSGLRCKIQHAMRSAAAPLQELGPSKGCQLGPSKGCQLGPSKGCQLGPSKGCQAVGQTAPFCDHRSTNMAGPLYSTQRCSQHPPSHIPSLASGGKTPIAFTTGPQSQ
eukprot:3812840-Rhodomonas_salina.3